MLETVLLCGLLRPENTCDLCRKNSKRETVEGFHQMVPCSLSCLQGKGKIRGDFYLRFSCGFICLLYYNLQFLDLMKKKIEVISLIRPNIRERGVSLLIYRTST